ncbi:6-phosphofructokinase [Lachnospiraceae bacterium JC7]|nr:6-phosphofructokinase [Lachnospiraceae bacterium JC7]
MNKNLLVAQSGGPTAAINATLAGIIEEALKSSTVEKVYGAKYGIQGVLQENFIELSSIKNINDILETLSVTPAAALGSCRYKLQDPAKDPSEFQSIIDIFRKNEIGYFIYIGGNDSMDTVWKLSEYIKEHNIDDIVVIGAPKTIDNDLYGIDHCPGFGSAAKYIATSISELERELEVYDTPYVIVVEMMGRNAGWLTAAAALAEGNNSNVPYLIYLEEHPFDLNNFISDVRGELSICNNLIVAISEGIRDKSGKMICDYADRDQSKDAFGHTIATGAGRVLENAIRSNIGCKVRYIELNLLQRCAGHLLSETDIRESLELGRNAVRLALNGENGVMSTLTRLPGEKYEVSYGAADISQIADREKKVPVEWINEEGNGVKEEMIRYLTPLVQGELSCKYENGIPKYIVL